VVRQGVSVSVAARNEVFISYSHRDAAWLERLRVHLEPLVNRDRLQVWDDGSIEPGDRWLDELRDAVGRARVAILLVSPDYLASRFIAREELTPILRAAESDGLRVFWIPVRASIVDKTELASLQAAQPPEKPLAGLRGAAVDRALASIARSIYEVFEQASDPGATPTTFAEVSSPDGTRTVTFEGERVTVGRAVGNDVVLVDDEASRWHAVFERLGPLWYVRDLSSRNGTSVNGQRVGTERRLRPGDDIRIGQTSLVFHSEEAPKEAETTRAAGAPLDLTSTEREVLVELARPLASGHASAEPAADRDIADALGLEEAEVANHIARLVEKFAILIGPAQRTRLADAAVKRGAIGATDLGDRPQRAR
jgi:pSer/pThr/pTyr-binding forkhead associated (FHA) protein